MNKAQRKQFRKDRADDLRTLGRELGQLNIIRDVDPFTTAAPLCKQGDQNWKYNLNGVSFINIDPDDKFRKSNPKGLDKESLEIELDIELEGICTSIEDTFDPFSKLKVDIVINGVDNIGNKLKSAWHLDRNENNELQTESYFIHPIYHFQHGGDKIWGNSNFNYGETIMLESPRIPHPPLDGILAVDFILANFYGSKWKELRTNNASYQRVVSNSLRLFWIPYIYSAASFWNGRQNNLKLESSWDGCLIYPQKRILN